MKNHVNVIRHQAPCVQLNAECRTLIRKGFKKEIPVDVVFEQYLFTDSPYDDVINAEFVTVVNEYVNGGYGDEDEAMEAFASAVQEALG